MLDPLSAVVGGTVTVALAAAAAAGRALTPGAATVAGVFGVVIVVFAGFGFLGVLITFVVVSSLATRYRFEEKRRRNVQEGRAGERGVSNVLAHIVLPTGVAVLVGIGRLPGGTGALLFASALSFALADTLASEFGVLSGSARSILTLRTVRPGTNGGVSDVGEAFALGGALVTGLLGVGTFALTHTPFGSLGFFLLTVVGAGFVSCQVDSILGETLENRGLLTKGWTNFLGMLSAILLALLAAAIWGPLR